jgi:hypothetical protein
VNSEQFEAVVRNAVDRNEYQFEQDGVEFKLLLVYYIVHEGWEMG